ncbi:hypothetical protein AGMMS49574_19180 [Bacteroidia bacterium]|nr:hypothetical protein AGMMS49574_19180 [Bacteroidia bacterium]
MTLNYCNIEYKCKTVSHEILLDFFRQHFHEFIPPLDTMVCIEEYVKKLFDYSVIVEAWHEQKLIGLIAVYCNNQKTKGAYISSVIVSKNYINNGVASSLLSLIIQYVKERGFQYIILEVNKENYPAYQLYLKSGFFKIEEKENTCLMKKLL